MLKETIKHIVTFDAETLELLTNLFSEVQLRKGAIFAKKGEYSRKIAFVKSGVLRAYYSNDQAEEYNKTFFTENNFVGAYSALITQKKNLIDVRKEKREIELVTLEAKERYAIFQQEHPQLEQLIPQYHIASYLGVSPTQLSRIRAQK
jgi:CRP-like cAMP-binding protein